MVKYPRTYHLPFSQGKTSDDKVLSTDAHLIGKKVVVTKKMDGECTTMYAHHIHARSLDSANHPSRNWVKSFHGSIRHLIPENYRICGENLYARHSIAYNNLKSYFYAFSVWENNTCLNWAETTKFLSTIGVEPVEVLYQGAYSTEKIQQLISELDLNSDEGIVVRLADGFLYDDFKHSVAKWVRKNHVNTDQHWMHSEIIKNTLLEQI